MTGLPQNLDGYPIVDGASIDTRAAASEILAAYLDRLIFEVAGDPVRRFRLGEVLQEWPNAEKALVYPAASITATQSGLIAHSLTPTPLECTWDKESGTMLWQTGDLSVPFQVDFWTTNVADREAIASRLPMAFSPTESRSGVILSGTPSYYSLPARATLEAMRRIDTGDTVAQRERRLRTTIRVDLDVVHMRSVRPLSPLWSPISAVDNS